MGVLETILDTIEEVFDIVANIRSLPERRPKLIASLSVVLVLTAVYIFTGMAYRTASPMTYDEEIAKRVLLPVASAVYTDHPQWCLLSVGWEILGKWTTDCMTDTCSVLLAVHRKKRILTIAFRGSYDTQKMVSHESFAEMLPEFGKTKIGQYYSEALTAFPYDGTSFTRIEYFLRRYGYYEIWMTGHSLGGALTSTMAVHLVKNMGVDPRRMRIYTFGAPRVGDEAFANMYDELFPASFRIVRGADPVPQIHESLNYRHHSTEIFYPNSEMEPLSFTKCSGQEDNKCSKSVQSSMTSMGDHDVYFGRKVASWAIRGCPQS